ncbi:MAG: hypothetical protein ACYCSI_04750 [Solirubrobacteraceae bacterium]
MLATIAVGVYGLLRGPGQTGARTGGAPVSRASGDRGGSASAPVAAPPVLPRTDDPLRYARAVAAAIFDWSTTSGYSVADYTSPVLADADPSGQELPGLIEDLGGYEPSSEQWAQLTRMKVVQRLRIQSAGVPSLWRQALAQAHGRLRRGTTAVTITGVRSRAGVFYGQPETSSNPVSFTIFEVCAPAYPRCHTLRLSRLNDPLR